MILSSLLSAPIFLTLYSIGLKAFAFILVIMIIVTIHEFGHYIVARMIGADVEVFSIGIGKKLISFKDKNQTVWQISMLPLGGYVRIKGENGENLGEKEIENNENFQEKKEENNFEDKSPWQKSLVVLAGPFFNFFLSFIVIFSLFFFQGKPSFDLSGEYGIVISSVSPGGIASKSGLEKGDKILEINSEKLKNFDDLQEKLKKNIGSEINLKIFSIQKNIEEEKKIKLEGDGKLGVGLIPEQKLSEKFEKLSLKDSVIQSFNYNLKLIKLTVLGILRIFTTPSEMKQIGGIMQIADFSGAAIQSGFINFLFFLALLSINLGVINLFPIPALDGGRFLFYFLDMIWIGKLIGPKIRSYSILLSFFLLIGLMIFANLNDISKIFFHK